jgi:hypothetical protein
MHFLGLSIPLLLLAVQASWLIKFGVRSRCACGARPPSSERFAVMVSASKFKVKQSEQSEKVHFPEILSFG